MPALLGDCTCQHVLSRSAIMGAMSDDDRAFTAKEAAEYLHVHHQLVIREAKAGHLPGRKIGRTWRFSEAALRTWLQGQEQQPPPE
jgi:excisionase family DNA binding protein